MALSCEELLNILRGRVEDRGELSGGHLCGWLDLKDGSSCGRVCVVVAIREKKSLSNSILNVGASRQYPWAVRLSDDASCDSVKLEWS